jgi:hypothetical protein
MTEIVATLWAFTTTRQSGTFNAVRQLKKASRKGFSTEGKERSCFIEVVSNCPSGWKMTPPGERVAGGNMFLFIHPATSKSRNKQYESQNVDKRMHA